MKNLLTVHNFSPFYQPCEKKDNLHASKKGFFTVNTKQHDKYLGGKPFQVLYEMFNSVERVKRKRNTSMIMTKIKS